MNDPVLKRSIFLIALVALLHWTATKLQLYWTVWWYDLLMHFLGGFWVGLAAVGALRMPRVRAALPRVRPLPFAVAAMAVVGTAWEIFEYAADLTFVDRGYALDTATDFMLGFAGAVSSLAYAKWLLKRRGIAFT